MSLPPSPQSIHRKSISKLRRSHPDSPSSAIFNFLPERSGFDHIKAYNEQATSAAFSFAPSPPLRVKTIPQYVGRSSRLPPGLSITLPANITIIRSTGKLSHVESLSQFPLGGSGNTENAVENQPESTVSPESERSDTPNFQCQAGPRSPPEPAHCVERPQLPTGLFLDPFTEYMLDRLARFRPLDGQSNPNMPLDFAHPYQANDDSPQQSLWTNWLTNRWQPAPSAPVATTALSPLVEGPPAASGSSLFLPRDAPQLITEEPASAALEATPQAELLEDSKTEDGPESLSGQCIWCLC